MNSYDNEQKSFDKELRRIEKAKQELAAINNDVKPLTINNKKKSDKKRNRKGKGINKVGMSANNSKWMGIRNKRYNDSVWKGWRESDDKPNPVKTFKMGKE